MKDKDKWLKRQRGKIDFLIDNKNGFQYNALKNYTKKQRLRGFFSKLTPLEMLIYCAYQVNTLREIAKYLKKSHVTISRIYKKAYRKLHNPIK